MADGERGGALVCYGQGEGTLGFIPADVARRIISLSPVTKVPGLAAPAVGVALADGMVVTVLSLSARGGRPADADPCAASEPVTGAAILCDLGGLVVAIVGGTVIATGTFPAAAGGSVLWGGATIPVIDVRALYAAAESETWATRAANLHGRGRPPEPTALRSERPEDRGTS